MNNKLQSYFDSAKNVKNQKPLLSGDEISSLVDNAKPVTVSGRTPVSKGLLSLATIAAIGGAVAILLQYTDFPYAAETQTALKQSAVSITRETPIESPKPIAETPVQSVKPYTRRPLTQNHPDYTLKPRIHQAALTVQPSLEVSKAVTNETPLKTVAAKDIEGLKVIDLSENEALVLAAHYPKLYAWLHKNYSVTDTCDITLTPSSAHERSSSSLHSVVFLKIHRENSTYNSQSDEFILWFTPTIEFADALPMRYKAPFRSELKARTEVETNCVPAERACRAMRGSSPFFDLCRRESGALSSVSISPNPASESAECTFMLQEQRDIYISLHEVSGKFVKTMIYNEPKTIGEQKVPLLLQEIPNGAYLVAISTGRGEQAVIQLIIQK